MAAIAATSSGQKADGGGKSNNRTLSIATTGLVDDDAVDEVIARHMLTPSPHAPASNGTDGGANGDDNLWWKKKLNSWDGRSSNPSNPGLNASRAQQFENGQRGPGDFPALQDLNGNGRHVPQTSPDR